MMKKKQTSQNEKHQPLILTDVKNEMMTMESFFSFFFFLSFFLTEQSVVSSSSKYSHCHLSVIWTIDFCLSATTFFNIRKQFIKCNV